MSTGHEVLVFCGFWARAILCLGVFAFRLGDAARPSQESDIARQLPLGAFKSSSAYEHTSHMSPSRELFEKF